jgi:hypothetical protein
MVCHKEGENGSDVGGGCSALFIAGGWRLDLVHIMQPSGDVMAHHTCQLDGLLTPTPCSARNPRPDMALVSGRGTEFR